MPTREEVLRVCRKEDCPEEPMQPLRRGAGANLKAFA